MRTWGLVFPFIGLLAIYFIFLSLRLRPQALPFTMTVLLFVAAFLTLAVMLWPHMIPYGDTAARRRCPSSSGAPGCSYSFTPRRCTGCSVARAVRGMWMHTQAILRWTIVRFSPSRRLLVGAATVSFTA